MGKVTGWWEENIQGCVQTMIHKRQLHSKDVQKLLLKNMLLKSQEANFW